MRILFGLFVMVAVAVGLTLIALSVAASAVAAASMVPWLLVAAGIWLVARSRDRTPRRRWDRAYGHPQTPPTRAYPPPTPMPARGHAPPPMPFGGHAPTPTVETRRPSQAAAKPPPRELPIDLQVKVEQIRRKVDVLLGYADRFPPFSQDLHIVRQTAVDYLPRTVATYLALPGDGDPVVAATGKTALQELAEQLELLDSKLDEIARDLSRQDVERLIANRRFLEERFGLREPETESRPRVEASDAA